MMLLRGGFKPLASLSINRNLHVSVLHRKSSCRVFTPEMKSYKRNDINALTSNPLTSSLNKNGKNLSFYHFLKLYYTQFNTISLQVQLWRQIIYFSSIIQL